MREDYKKQLCGQIEKNYLDLEQRILSDIVRRIKKAGKITSTADWQINRLKILGYSSEDIENMIKTTLNLSYPEVFELYDKVIDREYVRNKDIYEQINAEFIPYEQNKELQQLTEGFIRQSNEELKNITQSMGFYVDYGNGKRVITPLAEIYQGYLDAAMNDIAFGTFDYNTVLRKVVTQLTNSGLRYVDYASGWHNRVDVAARRAVMTGVSQLTGKISDMNAEKLGTEHFEVAWHGGARPEHARWQGKVWSKKELVTVCGLGTGPGLLGWNCYHEYYPFIKGISERNWSDEWLAEQNRKENTPKTFKGKEYTLYEAKQQQRKMETAMRAQREKVVLLKDGGADPDEVMLARAKYQGQLDEYGRFCKKMGLPQERERIYYDMRGRIAPSKKQYRKIWSSGNNTTVYDITDKSIEKVNKLSISTNDNSDKLREYHKLLLKDAREHNKSYETAYVINEDFTLRKVVYGDKSSINLSGFGNAYLILHNHPNNSNHSLRDIQWLCSNNAQGISVVKNNGECLLLMKTDSFSENKVKTELKRLIKKYQKDIDADSEKGYTKVVNDFLKDAKLEKCGLKMLR